MTLRFILHLLLHLCCLGKIQSQNISVTGVGVTGRFNSCSGSNTPSVSAQLISNSGGASVSGGLFTCINPCDSSTIRVTISNIKWNKSPNAEWLHGLFLPANAGFSIVPISLPSGFIAYNTGCVGTCPSGSGVNGGPGFYFDNTNSNSCCPGISANDGIPCNNFGDVSIGCTSPFSLSFDLTFCNSIITSSQYQFIFTGSSDGETGCYNFNDLLSHYITFTIPTVPCSNASLGLNASPVQRTCLSGIPNYTSMLSGNCSAGTTHWWDAPVGGNLIGTGSPFIYDPPGSVCPAGTTLYATCCASANPVCVPRAPIVIPGSCIPLKIDSLQLSQPSCTSNASINNTLVSGAIGTITYTLQPGALINTTGVFTGLTQSMYTLTVTESGGCADDTIINFSPAPYISLTVDSLIHVSCLAPSSGRAFFSAVGGIGSLTFSIQPAATQISTGVFAGLSAQAYTISVSDAVGCSASSVILIQAPILPGWSSVSVNHPTCHGFGNGSINVFSSNAVSYLLQPSGMINSTGLFNALSSGIYTVIASDSSGCTIDSILSMNYPAPLGWNNILSTPVSCSYLSDGSINISAVGGTGLLNYQLLPAGVTTTTGIFNGLAVGNYTIQVTDANGCTTVTGIQITGNGPLHIDSMQLNMPGCFGVQSSSITLSASGGTGNLSYTLQPSAISNLTGNFSMLGAGIYTVQVNDANNCLTTTTVTLTQPAKLDILSVAVTSPTCFNDASGQLSSTAGGGSGPIQYTLIPSGISNTTGMFNGLQAGTYTLFISDSNNCTVDSIIQITQPNALTWTNIILNGPTCYGIANGQFTLLATGGTGTITYQVQPGLLQNTSGNFTNLIAGFYTVTATDANNCLITTLLDLTQSAALQWTNAIATPALCFGTGTGSIQAGVSGGTGSIVYSLTSGGLSNSSGIFSGLIAGTYTVVATDINGCSALTTLSISQPPVLLIDSVTSTTPTCVPGNDAMLQISASGGSGMYQYNIGGAMQVSNQFQFLNAGTYTVFAEDANGCSISAVHIITPPSLPVISSVTTTALTCIPGNDGSIVINCSGGELPYTYSLNGSLPQTSNLYGLLAAGNYMVTVVDGNGCTASSLSSLSAPALPVISNVTVSNTSCIPGCDGSLLINVLPGSSTLLQFSNGTSGFQTSNFFTGLCANTYNVIVTDANGCSATTNILLANTPAPVISNLNSNPALCFGQSNGSIQMSAVGGTGLFNYSITPTGIINTTGIFNNLSAGMYTLTVSDANGCNQDTVASVTQPLPFQFSNVIINSTLCAGVSNGSIQFSTTGGTGAISYGIAPSGTFVPPNTFTGLSGNITYTITATDINTCNISTSCFVPMANLLIVNAVNTSPLSCSVSTNGSIQVFASGGTGVLTYQLQPGSLSNGSGNFTGLSAGNYSITVSDANGCSQTTNTVLTAPTPVQLTTFSVQQVTCHNFSNGSITCSATGGSGSLSYQLLPGSVINSSGVFNGLPSGSYTIIVSDANGCTTGSVTNLNNPAALQWNSVLSNPLICFGDSNASFNVNGSGGTGSLTYQLLPTGTLSASGIFSNLTASTYTLSAVDSLNCLIDTVITISQPAPISILGVSIHDNTCFYLTNGSIQVQSTGGTLPHQYTLFPGGASSASGLFTGLTAGNYTVIVQDATGCSFTISSLQINQPPAINWTSTLSQDIACFGDSSGSIQVTATGGTGVLSYSIQPIAGTQFPAGTFTFLPANSYIVTATDVSGCTITNTISVSQSPKLIFTQVELIQPRCFGESNGQLLIVSGGGTSPYLYSLNGSVPDTTTLFTNLISASYSINITDASGCLLDTILFLNQAAPLQISYLEISPISCEQASNGKISISGIGGNGILSYTLLPGGITNQSGNFTNLAFGIYTVSISDSVGCNLDTIVAIPLPENPMRIITRKQDLGCSGTGTEGWAEVSIEGGEGPYQISWNTSPPQFTSKIDNLTYGYYAVEVTDANGCQDKDTVYIKPGECCEQIFIPNAFSPNNDGLNDVFRIYTTAAIELLQYAVYDRWGNKVWSTLNHLDSWDGRYNNGKTEVGTYFYIFRYTCLIDGKTYLRSGDITILR